MKIEDGLFSSESVSEGHPDKLADRISDKVLDAFLSLDPNARVACEVMLADQTVVVAGECRARDGVFRDVRERVVSLVADVLRDSGYGDAETGIDPERCEVQVRLRGQAVEIARGVDREDGTIGAGDQGIMFGHACDETPELMPAPLVYAHRLMLRQAELRRTGQIAWLRSDAKSQVTFRYENGRPVEVAAIVLSTQHDRGVSASVLHERVMAEIVDVVVPSSMRAANCRVLINPTGSFVVGGPNGDTGLTGRKIIVDTYGGAAPHGGGAFSGKDPSKVDRSAAYMARFLARQVVSRGWAKKCTLQLAYAIGVAEPVSFLVDADGASRPCNREITEQLRSEFELTPAGIMQQLDLRRPIYYPTAAYGHFGRVDVDLPWEANGA
ncbi:MAG: methionine adenosyltransferase [Planctomycetota bacterium]